MFSSHCVGHWNGCPPPSIHNIRRRRSHKIHYKFCLFFQFFDLLEFPISTLLFSPKMSIWLPFALISLIGCANAFYPVYKLEESSGEEEKRAAVDTIRRPSKFNRGAFISPLFGYRFMSLEPMGPSKDSLQSPPPAAPYDPIFFAEPEKRNFYTHIWRDIVQRMPAYHSNGPRLFQSAENDEPLLDKRSPIDRMHAIRTG